MCCTRLFLNFRTTPTLSEQPTAELRTTLPTCSRIWPTCNTTTTRLWPATTRIRSATTRLRRATKRLWPTTTRIWSPPRLQFTTRLRHATTTTTINCYSKYKSLSVVYRTIFITARTRPFRGVRPHVIN